MAEQEEQQEHSIKADLSNLSQHSLKTKSSNQSATHQEGVTLNAQPCCPAWTGHSTAQPGQCQSQHPAHGTITACHIQHGRQSCRKPAQPASTPAPSHFTSQRPSDEFSTQCTHLYSRHLCRSHYHYYKTTRTSINIYIYIYVGTKVVTPKNSTVSHIKKHI